MKTKKEEKQKPEKKYRSGQVTATIWGKKLKSEKTEKPYTSYSIVIEKSYTDENKEWQKTSSFFTNDLIRVRAVLDKAIEYVLLSKDKEIIEEEMEE